MVGNALSWIIVSFSLRNYPCQNYYLGFLEIRPITFNAGAMGTLNNFMVGAFPHPTSNTRSHPTKARRTANITRICADHILV